MILFICGFKIMITQSLNSPRIHNLLVYISDTPVILIRSRSSKFERDSIYCVRVSRALRIFDEEPDKVELNWIRNFREIKLTASIVTRCCDTEVTENVWVFSFGA